MDSNDQFESDSREVEAGIRESDLAPAPEPPAEAHAEAKAEPTEVQRPDFPEFQAAASPANRGDLSRIQNIQIRVSAELGQTNIPIEELLQVEAGSVLELDRAVDEPVQLVAQGVPLAAGEVVVLDGQFAVRITQVYEN